MLVEKIKTEMLVRISTYAKKTEITHGLNHPTKISMQGRTFPVQRVKDYKTIVIKNWHFHPDDLTYAYEAYDTPREKKEYVPVIFNVENIL